MQFCLIFNSGKLNNPMQLVATVLNSVARERAVWREYPGGMRRRNNISCPVSSLCWQSCVGVGWCRESGKGKKEVGRRESVYHVVAPLHLSHHFSACLPTVWFCPTQGPLVCPMSSELTQTHQLLSLTSSNFDYKLCVNTSQVYICSLSSLSQAQTTGISTWKSY